jgi:hypothetical protein
MKSLLKYFTLSEYLDESCFPQHEPIVEELLAKQELTLLTATAKSGKTWLALHLALAVASGSRFLGAFNTRKAKVLFIQTEVSHSQFRDRIVAMLPGIDSEHLEENLIISPERVRIDTSEGLGSLSGLVAETACELLILDPLYTLHRGDEDKAREVAPMLGALKELCANHNSACLLVHHQGKAGETNGRQTGHRARGSSALADVPDNSWSLRKAGEEHMLAFEFRNLPPRDPLRLHFDKSHVWSSFGVEPVQAGKGQSVIELISGFGEISRVNLISEAKLRFGISERTLDSILMDAVRQGSIARRLEGKAAIYSAPSSSPQSPQDRNSPDSCGLADDDEARRLQLNWEAANARDTVTKDGDQR